MQKTVKFAFSNSFLIQRCVFIQDRGCITLNRGKISIDDEDFKVHVDVTF